MNRHDDESNAGNPEGMPAASGWREMKQVPPTAQSFADGFQTYADGIKRTLSELGNNRTHPELPTDYRLYRDSIVSWTQRATEHLGDDCPPFADTPTLEGNDFYAALVRLAEHCELLAKQLEEAKKPKGATAPLCADTGLSNLPDETLLPTSKLARLGGVNPVTLRKRLERLRTQDHQCFIEVEDAKGRNVQFYYYVGKVRPIIEQMKASDKSTGKRPTTE